jgi:hypothetical protein
MNNRTNDNRRLQRCVSTERSLTGHGIKDHKRDEYHGEGLGETDMPNNTTVKINCQRK